MSLPYRLDVENVSKKVQKATADLSAVQRGDSTQDDALAPLFEGLMGTQQSCSLHCQGILQVADNCDIPSLIQKITNTVAIIDFQNLGDLLRTTAILMGEEHKQNGTQWGITESRHPFVSILDGRSEVALCLINTIKSVVLCSQPDEESCGHVFQQWKPFFVYVLTKPLISQAIGYESLIKNLYDLMIDCVRRDSMWRNILLDFLFEDMLMVSYTNRVTLECKLCALEGILSTLTTMSAKWGSRETHFEQLKYAILSIACDLVDRKMSLGRVLDILMALARSHHECLLTETSLTTIAWMMWASEHDDAERLVALVSLLYQCAGHWPAMSSLLIAPSLIHSLYYANLKSDTQQREILQSLLHNVAKPKNVQKTFRCETKLNMMSASLLRVDYFSRCFVSMAKCLLIDSTYGTDADPLQQFQQDLEKLGDRYHTFVLLIVASLVCINLSRESADDCTVKQLRTLLETFIPQAIACSSSSDYVFKASYIILYYTGRPVPVVSKRLLLEQYVALSKNQYLVKFVLEVVLKLTKTQVARPLAVSLMTSLYEQNIRTFPELETLLKMTTKTAKTSEMFISNAQAAFRLCCHPEAMQEMHVAMVVRVVASIMENPDTCEILTARCLALEALVRLCEHGLLNVHSVWQSLGSQLLSYKNPHLVALVCRLLALFSEPGIDNVDNLGLSVDDLLLQLEENKDRYKLRSQALGCLWEHCQDQMLSNKPNALIVTAVVRSLSRYHPATIQYVSNDIESGNTGLKTADYRPTRASYEKILKIIELTEHDGKDSEEFEKAFVDFFAHSIKYEMEFAGRHERTKWNKGESKFLSTNKQREGPNPNGFDQATSLLKMSMDQSHSAVVRGGVCVGYMLVAHKFEDNNTNKTTESILQSLVQMVRDAGASDNPSMLHTRYKSWANYLGTLLQAQTMAAKDEMDDVSFVLFRDAILSGLKATFLHDKQRPTVESNFILAIGGLASAHPQCTDRIEWLGKLEATCLAILSAENSPFHEDTHLWDVGKDWSSEARAAAACVLGYVIRSPGYTSNSTRSEVNSENPKPPSPIALFLDILSTDGSKATSHTSSAVFVGCVVGLCTWLAKIASTQSRNQLVITQALNTICDILSRTTDSILTKCCARELISCCLSIISATPNDGVSEEAKAGYQAIWRPLHERFIHGTSTPHCCESTLLALVVLQRKAKMLGISDEDTLNHLNNIIASNSPSTSVCAYLTRQIADLGGLNWEQCLHEVNTKLNEASFASRRWGLEVLFLLLEINENRHSSMEVETVKLVEEVFRQATEQDIVCDAAILLGCISWMPDPQTRNPHLPDNLEYLPDQFRVLKVICAGLLGNKTPKSQRVASFVLSKFKSLPPVDLGAFLNMGLNGHSKVHLDWLCDFICEKVGLSWVSGTVIPNLLSFNCLPYLSCNSVISLLGVLKQIPIYASSTLLDKVVSILIEREFGEEKEMVLQELLGCVQGIPTGVSETLLRRTAQATLQAVNLNYKIVKQQDHLTKFLVSIKEENREDFLSLNSAKDIPTIINIVVVRVRMLAYGIASPSILHPIFEWIIVGDKQSVAHREDVVNALGSELRSKKLNEKTQDTILLDMMDHISKINGRLSHGILLLRACLCPHMDNAVVPIVFSERCVREKAPWKLLSTKLKEIVKHKHQGDGEAHALLCVCLREMRHIGELQHTRDWYSTVHY
eukprot:m.333418 g.333418  ORF g.333418 m.333418 type:complete len:1685 (+) comp17144_c0_seq1:193-5247(+)